MDLFSQIEGLAGENLGSALFSYLMFNSHEIRNSMLSLLSDKSPIGPISYASHFACRTEYPTTHPQFGDGRLDILVQLDDVVIGIENKFFAQFQNNQPQKYFDTLESVAKSLKSINRSETRSIMYVFCPDFRKEDAYKKIKGLERISIVTWEEILKQLGCVDVISNPVARIVKNEFAGYLKRHFSFIYDFERKVIHFRNIFPEYGSPLQGELVGKLRSLFPRPGGRLSNGKTWIGYYFYSDPDIDEKGWFGFVPSSEIQYETENHAELIVASTYKPYLGDGFESIRMQDDYFIDRPNNTNAWVIKFDSDWNNLAEWRDKLSPFWSAVENEGT